MRREYYTPPILSLPVLDENEPRNRLIFVDSREIQHLLNLVEHAEQVRFYEGGTDRTEVEQYAYNLFLRIQNAMNLIGMIYPTTQKNLNSSLLLCDGSIHNRVDYPQLYSIIEDSLKIDADTFQTPDLRDRFIMGASTANPPTTTGGNAEITLTENQMPTHNHTTQPHQHLNDYPSLGIDIEGAGIPDFTGLGNPPLQIGYTSFETVIVNDSGGSDPIDITPPFYSLKYVMIAR